MALRLKLLRFDHLAYHQAYSGIGTRGLIDGKRRILAILSRISLSFSYNWSSPLVIWYGLFGEWVVS